jgi:hypothetical protein
MRKDTGTASETRILNAHDVNLRRNAYDGLVFAVALAAGRF